MVLISLVPRLTWMSVGRTNPSRAGNFTSEASCTENVAYTPPHIIHNWILQHVRKAWTLSKLGQVTLGRGWSWFSCTPYLSTHAHPVYPLDFCQFTTWICSQESFHISHGNTAALSIHFCWTLLSEQMKPRLLLSMVQLGLWMSTNSTHGFVARSNFIFLTTQFQVRHGNTAAF